MRGGNGYGIGQPITAGAVEWTANDTSASGGAPYKPTGGRRRSRKTRRGRKTRRRRSMRGGGSVGGVGYSFAGDGARGLANHSAYESNAPASGTFAIPSGTR